MTKITKDVRLAYSEEYATYTMQEAIKAGRPLSKNEIMSLDEFIEHKTAPVPVEFTAQKIETLKNMGFTVVDYQPTSGPRAGKISKYLKKIEGHGKFIHVGNVATVEREIENASDILAALKVLA